MFTLRQSVFAAAVVALVGGQAMAQPRQGFQPPQPSHSHNHNNNHNSSHHSPSGIGSSKYPGSYRRPSMQHVTRYEFGNRAHVRQLSEELYNQANTICWEMHDYYDKNPGYNRIYRDMYEIKEGAKKINEMVKRSSPNSQRRYNSDPQIVRELQSLDRQFQEFQADVENWRPNSRRTSKSTLTDLIAQCEDTLCHLMDDYGVKYNQRQYYGRGPSYGNNYGTPGFNTPRR